MLRESEIEKPDWVQIAKGLGFQLHDQPSSNSFLNEWNTFASYSMLSWENLARAFKKMKAKDSSVRKIRDRTGMVMTNGCSYKPTVFFYVQVIIVTKFSLK